MTKSNVAKQRNLKSPLRGELNPNLQQMQRLQISVSPAIFGDIFSRTATLFLHLEDGRTLPLSFKLKSDLHWTQQPHCKECGKPTSVSRNDRVLSKLYTILTAQEEFLEQSRSCVGAPNAPTEYLVEKYLKNGGTVTKVPLGRSKDFKQETLKVVTLADF